MNPSILAGVALWASLAPAHCSLWAGSCDGASWGSAVGVFYSLVGSTELGCACWGLRVGSQPVPQAGTGLVPSCFVSPWAAVGSPSPWWQCWLSWHSSRRKKHERWASKHEPIKDWFPSTRAGFRPPWPPNAKNKHIRSRRTSCQVLGFTVLTALNKFFLEITDLLGSYPSEGKASHN